MQPIEPALLGMVVDATADAEDPDQFIATVVDTYLAAYELEQLDDIDKPRVQDLFNRLNGLTNLRNDDRFEFIFEASKGKIYGELIECVASAEYTLDEEGIAVFNHDEIITQFLELMKSKSN